MTLVRRPSPLGELMSLRQAMDRLFEDSFVRPRMLSTGWVENGTLALDIASNADSLVVEAALPGVGPDDVEITIEGGTLTIAASTQSEREEGEADYLIREIRRGSFSRTVALPEGLEPDKATATFDHGILTLRIPKAEQVKPRQIRISPASSGDERPAEASRS